MRIGADEEGEKVRREQEFAIDLEAETQSLNWAVRWVNSSRPRNSLPDPSSEHLFRC